MPPTHTTNARGSPPSPRPFREPLLHGAEHAAKPITAAERSPPSGPSERTAPSPFLDALEQATKALFFQ